MRDFEWWWSRVQVGGLCFVSSLFVSQYFWLMMLPSFLLFSCQSSCSSYFSLGESGGGRRPPIISAHSAFSRWHLLPTHLHCVPIMDTHAPVHTHSHTHTHFCCRLSVDLGWCVCPVKLWKSDVEIQMMLDFFNQTEGGVEVGITEDMEWNQNKVNLTVKNRDE